MGQYDKDHLPFCDDGDYDDDDVDDEKYLPAFLVSETNCLQISVEDSELHSWERMIVMMVIMKRMNNQLVSSINDELKMMLLLMLFTSRLVFCSLCLLVTSLPSFSRSRE